MLTNSRGSLIRLTSSQTAISATKSVPSPPSTERGRGTRRGRGKVVAALRAMTGSRWSGEGRGGPPPLPIGCRLAPGRLHVRGLRRDGGDGGELLRRLVDREPD